VALHLLLWIIGRIAEEARKDAALNTIRELDDDALGVCLLKFSFENELDDGMDQLPLTVCDYVCRG
jgi:hypothetical protein